MARLTETQCRAICKALGVDPDRRITANLVRHGRPWRVGGSAWIVVQMLSEPFVQRAASESEGTPSPALSEEEKR